MQPLPLGLDPPGYWIVLSVAVAITPLAFYFAWRNWRRARIIEDAPTAKVRSAHQGYLELEGSGRLMAGEPIIAPLTSQACLWYRYKIERKETFHTKHGNQTRWVTEREEVSDNLFYLEDDTGQCVVDPDGAEFSSGDRLQWYGDSSWPQNTPLQGSGSLFSSDRYRYTEWLVLPGQPLYVIGQFKTIAPAQLYKTADITRDLIRDWKKDQKDLLQRFDVNGDGQIDTDEWQLVRKSAQLHAQAEFRERAKQPEIHMIAKPDDDKHPFILSIHPQHQLTKRFRLHAYLYLGGFFVAGCLAVWLLQFQV
ncbi:MAG TPA: E3 ubiquitin--protein ligase [Candidatus Tenderia electrophaga]|uniref:RING-type E3 ubiquitin transferase n=1 Tax=Candidatus Tenderia electrophaga TaxID=1748243 RepID=A0A832J8W2_9GAMM|nr:E3 ubiquitin--protein ligase [Candidatus Tenderia electrophaga]